MFTLQINIYTIYILRGDIASHKKKKKRNSNIDRYKNNNNK